MIWEKKMRKQHLSTKECIEIDERYGVNVYKRYPELAGARAQGAHFWTPDGIKILDLLGCFGTTWNHGWKVPQMAYRSCTLDALSGLVPTPERARFLLAMRDFTGFPRAFAKSGGGEMIETAYTTLFMHAANRGIKDPVIGLIDGFFHGRMRSSTTNSSDPAQYAGKGPCVPGYVRIPRTVEAVRNAISANMVGIVLEKHQGEAGPIFDGRGNESFYAAVHRIARENNILVVLDDVQAGMYRCGYPLSYLEDGEHYRPDAAVLAKALGGGVVAISALVGTEEFMSVFTPGCEGSTFSFLPGACAVATAVLEYAQKNPWIGERAIEVGNLFTQSLSNIPRVFVDNRGAMISIFVAGATSLEHVCHQMLSAEFPCLAKYGHVYKQGAHIRLSPPLLAVTDKGIREICSETIRPALERVSRQVVRERHSDERELGLAR